MSTLQADKPITVIIPRESFGEETKEMAEARVGLIPAHIALLKEKHGAGLNISVETGAGVKSGFTDQQYIAAGATVVDTGARDVDSLNRLYGNADIVAGVKRPGAHIEAQVVGILNPGAVTMNFSGALKGGQLTPHMPQYVKKGLSHIALEHMQKPAYANGLCPLPAMSGITGAIAVDEALGVAGIQEASGKNLVVFGTGNAAKQAISKGKAHGMNVVVFGHNDSADKQDLEAQGVTYVGVPRFTDSQDKTSYAEYQTALQQFAEKSGYLGNCDVFIGAADRHDGLSAPVMITSDMVARGVVKKGAVVTAVSFSNGCNAEPNAKDATSESNGVTFFCKSAFPAAQPKSSSPAFSEVMARIIDAAIIEKLVERSKSSVDMYGAAPALPEAGALTGSLCLLGGERYSEHPTKKLEQAQRSSEPVRPTQLVAKL